MMWPCFSHDRAINISIADADPEVATVVRESTSNSQPPLAMVNLSATVHVQGTNAEKVDEEEEDGYASLRDMQDGTADYSKQTLQSSTNPEGDEEYDSVEFMR